MLCAPRVQSPSRLALPSPLEGSSESDDFNIRNSVGLANTRYGSKPLEQEFTHPSTTATASWTVSLTVQKKLRGDNRIRELLQNHKSGKVKSRPVGRLRGGEAITLGSCLAIVQALREGLANSKRGPVLRVGAFAASGLDATPIAAHTSSVPRIH